jgi:hypothetical protein
MIRRLLAESVMRIPRGYLVSNQMNMNTVRFHMRLNTGHAGKEIRKECHSKTEITIEILRAPSPDSRMLYFPSTEIIVPGNTNKLQRILHDQ